MYNDTITLFNHYVSDNVDVWYPSVLRNVNVITDNAAIIAKYGAGSTDKAILNVRYCPLNGNKMIGDKIWIPSKEWANQSEEMLHKSITFATGNISDFFVVGEWKSVDPVSDDTYGIDGFYNYTNSNYDYVFSITSVGGPYTVIPHFEITGK